MEPEEELFKIMSDVQIRELITSLSTFREIPLKFEYLGRGAEHWAKVAEEREQSGGINAQEIEVWKNLEGVVRKELEGVNYLHVVDIGCGTGRPAFLLMDILQDMGIGFDYTAVDISPTMVEMATRNVKKYYGVDVDKIIVDLENELLPFKHWKEPTVFSLPGEHHHQLLLARTRYVEDKEDRAGPGHPSHEHVCGGTKNKEGDRRRAEIL